MPPGHGPAAHARRRPTRIPSLQHVPKLETSPADTNMRSPSTPALQCLPSRSMTTQTPTGLPEPPPPAGCCHPRQSRTKSSYSAPTANLETRATCSTTRPSGSTTTPLGPPAAARTPAQARRHSLQPDAGSLRCSAPSPSHSERVGRAPRHRGPGHAHPLWKSETAMRGPGATPGSINRAAGSAACYLERNFRATRRDLRASARADPGTYRARVVGEARARLPRRPRWPAPAGRAHRKGSVTVKLRGQVRGGPAHLLAAHHGWPIPGGPSPPQYHPPPSSAWTRSNCRAVRALRLG